MRVNAFTLLELLITMAVSAILISMAYLALRVIEQHQRVSLRTLRQVEQASTLQWLLTRDFRQASSVFLQSGELRCALPGYPVTYLVRDSFLIRRQAAVTDTFALPMVRKRYWLQGRPMPENNGLLDEVSFSLRFRRDTLHVHARIWYGAERLISPPAQSPSPL